MDQLPPIQPWMTRAEKMKIHRRKYAISAKGRAQASRSQQRFLATEKGRAKTKRWHERVQQQRPNKDRKAQQVKRAMRYYADGGRDIKSHVNLARWFQLCFEPWMNWSNYGPYVIGKPRTWCVGHQIPQDAYSDDPADVERCFDVTNMRPQCSKENALQRTQMPDPALLSVLKDVWPMAWS